MTYKLNPAIEKIVSCVVLMFPNGEKQQYEDGKSVLEAGFDHKYVIEIIRAVDNVIGIKLEEVDSLVRFDSFF